LRAESFSLKAFHKLKVHELFQQVKAAKFYRL